MDLPFFDRERERARLARALDRGGGLLCVYGRRRLGKSRLLREVLAGRRGAYYAGDERDAALQRQALARELEFLIPGFADVTYPEWDALFARWYSDAPPKSILTIDEFPSLVRDSPEIPSLLQKRLDSPDRRDLALIVCGSSQRMMHGLLLDSTAPLYGRAREILKLAPLEVGWALRAFKLRSGDAAVAHYATWGGVPRYWELARDFESREEAVRELVLDPLGILHREPERLILDEVQEVARTASVLALIGAGCHRLSEIAGRIGVPATSLSRVLALLVDLGFVRRDVPFGEDERRSKRGLYRLGDPFLRLFFRVVEPARSRLAAGRIVEVERSMQHSWPQLLSQEWEALARASVPRLDLFGTRWSVASSWWGNTLRGPAEIDLIAPSEDDPSRVLVGEIKLRADARDVPRLLSNLAEKAAACPALEGRRIEPSLWVLQAPRSRSASIVSGAQVVQVLL